MKGEFPIGWLWKDPKGRKSMVFGTEGEARDDAVSAAVKRQTGRTEAFARMSEDERVLIWRGLQRQGWKICRPKAVFS
ncbi:hypothetical protein SAMN04488527_101269 [Aliiroseovarius crassostreae]|uniref:Uncharacterized protein n=1 Tax=Aliiroseovarius crassostreae TaxID=154981 RepID=A0A0P7IX78_9RHOB|nr:hypothetical protein [Aliiroseovarius crassostreae]KPN64266.1 hypothetical protein AKJ29_16670 [Aliiroseovarius crassostreae]SFU31329.1 hypothetical protein SAMN04488527_101269 [Aliiroseovarius crassostreae]